MKDALKIVQRFEYATTSMESESDPEQDEFMTLLRGALPHLQRAIQDMKAAESLLQQGSLPEAVRTEMEVLKSLALAIEYFSDAKTLINIALQSQNQLVELLTPPSEETQVAEEQPSSEEREESITSILEQNDSRIKRLEQTLQREKAKEFDPTRTAGLTEW